MSTGFYNERYFRIQRTAGAFGAVANWIKFDGLIGRGDRVLDFGCGGGFLLAGLDCGARIGVEINPVARAEAVHRGVEMHGELAEIATGSIDTVVSDNALEHVDLPLAELKEMLRVLKPGGRAVVVVPCEGIAAGDRGAHDPDRHLHSWSPRAMACLMRRAGFEVLESKAFVHRWPPAYRLLQRVLGWPLFHVACRLWGCACVLYMAQVRTVARKAMTAAFAPLWLLCGVLTPL